MLAYVFWHVRRAGIGAPEYEAAHCAFHDALWEGSIPGLRGLRVRRLVEIPWLPGTGAGYEDWYLLEDSSVLDALNEAALSGARRGAHERIAALAGDGAAGLYAPRLGAPVDPVIAYWMSKPRGLSYPDFHASLQSLVTRGCCLWGRRMTLGPTPEYCLHAAAPVTVPYAAQELRVATLLRHG